MFPYSPEELVHRHIDYTSQWYIELPVYNYKKRLILIARMIMNASTEDFQKDNWGLPVAHWDDAEGLKLIALENEMLYYLVEYENDRKQQPGKIRLNKERITVLRQKMLSAIAEEDKK